MIKFFTTEGKEDVFPKTECFQCNVDFDDDGEGFQIISDKKKFLLYWTIETRIKDNFLKDFFPFEKIEKYDKSVFIKYLFYNNNKKNNKKNKNKNKNKK
jgi:hypothetical protein